ncbi:MAG: hypothetical protein P8R54_31825 [Myxococcota bacterium]|nr:hypothetical protein [Myxococcota bacterium]
MLMILSLLACSDPPPPPAPPPKVKPPPAEPEPEPEPEPVNEKPRIKGFVITPNAPNTDTTLQAKIDAVDPEGLVLDVDYAWSVNGRNLIIENGKRLESRNYKKGDIVELKATISDGENIVERAGRITIGNAPPIFISDPRNVQDLDGFRLSVSDPDGDAITYQIEGAPKGMTVGAKDGVIAYKGSVEEPGGEYDIRLLAVDTEGGEAIWEFSVAVSAGSPGGSN